MSVSRLASRSDVPCCLQHHTSLATNMTSLLSLPTELLVNIFASCPTAQTAECLSGANKALHAIWWKHTHHILEGIARSIPSYGEATIVAKMQHAMLPADELVDAIQMSSVDRTPLVLHFSLLFRNASLASSAVAAWKAWIASLPISNWRTRFTFRDLHHSYYLIRMLVTVHCCLDQQQELLRVYCSMLRATSTARLTTLDELCAFLREVRHDGLHIPHDIAEDEKDWNSTHELTQGSWTPGLDYAAKVVRAALYEREHVTYMLDDMIFDPQEWWPLELVM